MAIFNVDLLLFAYSALSIHTFRPINRARGDNALLWPLHCHLHHSEPRIRRIRIGRILCHLPHTDTLIGQWTDTEASLTLCTSPMNNKSGLSNQIKKQTLYIKLLYIYLPTANATAGPYRGGICHFIMNAITARARVNKNAKRGRERES